MPDQTIEKLRSHLATPINCEPAVVYLLSLVRKLIERDCAASPGFALKMYCHWTLHLNLSKPGTTLPFLNLVDQFILKTVSPGNSPTWPTVYEFEGSFSFMDEYHLFRDFVYLHTLRKELKECLSGYQLPNELCNENQQWYDFMAALSTVIEDGELTIKSNADTLRAVSKVVFCKSARRPLSKTPHIPFVIEWVIHFEDGRIARASVEAESHQPMMSHTLEVTGVSRYSDAT